MTAISDRDSNLSHQDLHIAFIGGGNMARAMVAGLLRSGHSPERIAVAEPHSATRGRMGELHERIALTAANAEAAAGADVLVLAVKPQVMPAVLDEIATVARPTRQLILSVAAGVRLTALARALQHTAIVRVMPNQPALIGAGMSVLVAAPGVSTVQKDRAGYVVQSIGHALWLDDEMLMDAVTAVSGSGPAYFYLFMETMENTAVDLGLPRETARMLVRQTALGAARTALATDGDLAGLRQSVTSPGGTTAAALAVMEAADLPDTLRCALIAARDRCTELGRCPS